MTKIMFVGDPHLDARTPASRKDSYSQTMLQKLRALDELATQYNVSDIILLGDVFNQRYQPLAYFWHVYYTFSQFKHPVYTIYGNHDVAYERADSFDTSPLNLLVSTGAVKMLKELTYGDTHIYGFNYTDTITPCTTSGYNICCAHRYYNTPLYKDYMSPTEALELHYQAYVLGHDHSVYEPIRNEQFVVIRDGSLSRGTAHQQNLHRDVYVTLFDTDTHEFTRVTLPTLPSTDVFKEIVYVNNTLQDSVEDVVNKLEFNSGRSIYDILDQCDSPDDIKQLVQQYLERFGIYRVTH